MLKKLIYFIIAINLFALSNSDVIANYWMDECNWGSVYDKSGNGYDLTPQNSANSASGGVIFRDGNLTSNHYLESNSYIPLSDNYSVKLWVKFPLEEKKDDVSDYFIADKDGSGNDFIYFKREEESSFLGTTITWYWCLQDDNEGEQCNKFDPPSDGWHMITFTANKNSRKTYFYIDNNDPDSMDYYVSGDLVYIGNSDADFDKKSIGAFIDEFIIFNKELNSSEVDDIYNNESNGLNFDGTKRYDFTTTPLEMEAGKVTIHSTFTDPTWTHVDFNRTFDKVPVVFSVATKQGSDPASVRIKNITKRGFDIVVTEPRPKDGKHIPMDVSYIAITPGLHQLDGHYIDVKTFSTNQYQLNPSDDNTGWSRVNLDIPICNSSVIMQIQTLNNLIKDIPGNPLRPWTTAVLKKVNANTLDIALERSEVSADSIEENETIAVLVAPGEVNGTFIDVLGNSIDYEFRWVERYFKGWDNDNKYYKDFLNNYDDIPLVVGRKNSRYGNNGGWARIWDLTEQNVSFVTDEDTYNDSERWHIAEDYSFFVFSKPFHIAKSVILHYKMDECSWDNDDTTYEIINSGKVGEKYNATAGNNAAVVINGKIYHGGDINSTDSDDKYIIGENNITLPDNYTISFWAQFPLSLTGHKKFQESTGGFFGSSNDVYYFNIADRPGSDNDFIYFKYDETNDKWYLCVTTSCQEFDEPSLSGWHMLSFTSDGSVTKFYLDKEENLSFDTSVGGDLGLIFNADYDSDNDNEPNGQSIGSIVDEFKIFNYVLSLSEIGLVYDNENRGLNWDGTPRAIGGMPIGDWRLDNCEFNGSEGEVRDFTGDGLDGTSYNGLEADSGKLCNGGKFDGEDDYIEIPKNDLLTISDTLTYMAWIKRTDPNVSKNDTDLETIFMNQRLGNGLYLVENSASSNQNKILFKLRIEGSVYKLYSSSEVNDTSWHHIAATYDGSQMKIYIDGSEDASLDVNGSIDTGNNSNFIGSTGDDSFFYGMIDEVKVYNVGLKNCEIATIYDYENNGKNYDGSDRSCPNCNKSTGPFDAWDIDHNISDRNITTKIVGSEFNLTIAALDENGSSESNFSGVVCARLISGDSNITDWNETKWSEESEKNATFVVNGAYKDVRVNIRWNSDSSLNCPLSDYNESNSSDNFAIRPATFNIIAPSKVKAGSEFNISFRALSSSGELVKDYNESINVRGDSADLEYNDTTCKTGSLNGTLNAFSNGESNNTLSYTEVGDVNFTIQEVNGSEFASVDSDDTPLSDRLIPSKSVTITFIPHHFKIDALLANYSDFTYLNRDLNISALLDINITAENENNSTTTNYNTKCYAKDIDINISKDIVYNNDEINVTKLIFYYLDADSSKSGVSVQDLSSDIQISYKESNFTTDNNGSTNIKIYFNFDRNSSKHSNPFEVKNVDINVSDEDISENDKNISGSAKFYYGNLITEDILAKSDDFNVSYEFAMYDENSSDPLIPNGAKEIGYNWWENLTSSSKDANVSDSEIVVSSDYNASNSISGVSVSVESIEQGKITFNIKRDDSDVKFAVIHLLAPNLKWIWYSKDSEYDISSDSTCKSHFCFSVSWNSDNTSNSESQVVKSGNFEGTEANVTAPKVGVKIFR